MCPEPWLLGKCGEDSDDSWLVNAATRSFDDGDDGDDGDDVNNGGSTDSGCEGKLKRSLRSRLSWLSSWKSESWGMDATILEKPCSTFLSTRFSQQRGNRERASKPVR